MNNILVVGGNGKVGNYLSSKLLSTSIHTFTLYH